MLDPPIPPKCRPLRQLLLCPSTLVSAGQHATAPSVTEFSNHLATLPGLHGVPWVKQGSKPDKPTPRDVAPSHEAAPRAVDSKVNPPASPSSGASSPPAAAPTQSAGSAQSPEICMPPVAVGRVASVTFLRDKNICFRYTFTGSCRYRGNTPCPWTHGIIPAAHHSGLPARRKSAIRPRRLLHTSKLDIWRQ